MSPCRRADYSRKQGGSTPLSTLPDGVMGQGQVKRDWVVSKGEDKYRRGMYTLSTARRHRPR